NARILFLTTFPDDDYIVKSLQIGAKGYILKQDFEGIAPALEAVIKGQSVFGEKIVTKLPVLMKQTFEFNYKSYGISEKEFDIITLVSEGLSNKEISTELFLSEGTVRNYISGILEKLNLRDRTQLAVFYYTNK
ncbi:MAG: response regulator transcription factor, partial [Oscillospiraceae bacterium]|nr:response regulator transcription factor [Oscillospiraceae bacterium]